MRENITDEIWSLETQKILRICRSSAKKGRKRGVFFGNHVCRDDETERRVQANAC